MKKILFALCLFVASFSVFAALTEAQISTLTPIVMAQPQLVEAANIGDNAAIAKWLNTADPAFYAWKTYLATQDIYDNITWANFTPQDSPDGTQAWANRSLACQGKQFNVQTLLTGRESINPSKQKIRDGLQDALTAIPSGANGASKGGGWSSVVAVMYRNATRAEKHLSTGTGTTASPAIMVFEGFVTPQEASLMR